MEIQRFETFTGAIFSTAHITLEDNQLLTACAAGEVEHQGVIIDDYAYGYWVYILGDPMPGVEGSLASFSEAFQNLYRLAREQGWSYIKLDQDGPEVSGLPKFDW